MGALVSHTIWCQNGWFPFHFGFCPSEAAWKKTLKGMTGRVGEPYPETPGNCMTLSKEHDVLSCIVTVHESQDEFPSHVASILTHEGVHVWQALKDSIQETEKPGVEFEAYTVQHIVNELIKAYEKTRGPLFVKPAKNPVASQSS